MRRGLCPSPDTSLNLNKHPDEHPAARSLRRFELADAAATTGQG
jgi:hypothetical protein